MKKIALAGILLLVCGLCAMADVTDSFKAGGVAAGGSASASYLNQGLSFDSSERSSWSISFAPSIAVFVLDFVDCSLTPSIGYTHTQLDAGNVSDSMTWGASVAVGSYFLLSPSSPYALHASLGVALTWSPGLPGRANGVPFNDESLVQAVAPFVTLSFYNFVTDRLAIDIALTPQLIFARLLRDVGGNAVSGTVVPSLNVAASAGITYVISAQRTTPVPAGSVLR